MTSSSRLLFAGNVIRLHIRVITRCFYRERNYAAISLNRIERNVINDNGVNFLVVEDASRNSDRFRHFAELAERVHLFGNRLITFPAFVCYAESPNIDFPVVEPVDFLYSSVNTQYLRF